VVKLIVNDKGAVISRKIVKGPGFGLNKRALSLARKLRFTPAIDTDDRPVTSVVVWTFTFALPD
jgi:TonB family protein